VVLVVTAAEEAKVKPMEVEPTVVFSAASKVEEVEETTAMVMGAEEVGAVEEGVPGGSTDLVEWVMDLADAKDRCSEDGNVGSEMEEVGEAMESAQETAETESHLPEEEAEEAEESEETLRGMAVMRVD